jgi:hypothetical protein
MKTVVRLISFLMRPPESGHRPQGIHALGRGALFSFRWCAHVTVRFRELYAEDPAELYTAFLAFQPEDS